MIEAALRGCANEADEAAVTREFTGPQPMMWGMAWHARGGRWILEHRRLLNRSLGADR